MKLIYILLLSILYSENMYSQENALGIRINGGTILDAEISYQKWLGDNNRIEANIGFGGGNYVRVLKISASYQWVWELEYPLNWYVGLGASSGYWNYNNDYPGIDDNGIFINAIGQIGVDYTFDFPIEISLDLRPEIGIIDGYNNDFDASVGFGIRYTF